MEKRIMVLGLALLAIGASSAMAASLTAIAPIGTDTATTANDIVMSGSTPYVSGKSAGSNAGFVWDPTNGARAVSAGGWALTSATGIGIRTVGGQSQLLVHGFSSGWPTVITSTDFGTTWAQGSRTTSIGGSPTTGSSNTLSALGTDDSFFDCFAQYSNGTNLYVEKGTGSPIAIALDGKGTSTQKSSVAGVSATGLTVGRRKGDGTNYWNYKLQWNGSGTPTPSYFKGLKGDNFGEAWSVSDDGTKIFGYSPVSDARTGNWPYMHTVATATTIELPTLAGTAGSTTNACPYGASKDGRYAVGMDYVGAAKAVLWDTQTGTVLDLTQFFSDQGLLGSFTNLSYAYAVTVDGAGNPWVVGYGSTASGNRGFVAMVPEPATLGLLLLGLPFLRRRRP